MYPTHKREEIAAALGRTLGAIRGRCSTLRLASKVVYWTDADVEMLRGKYARAVGDADLSLGRIAKSLGRSRANVCRKARELGLTNQKRPRSAQMSLTREALSRLRSPEDKRAAMSKAAKDRIKKNGHPRGFLGLKHTKEVRDEQSELARRLWRDPASGLNSEANRQRLSDRAVAMVVSGRFRGGGYSRTRSGRREDLDGLYVRSAWEANYARYLNWLVAKGEIAEWSYEPKTFEFEKIKRGTRAYTPDFLVTFPDGRHEWHEVKGWMDDKSRVRMERMAKYYPDEKLVLIDAKWFREATKALRGLIPGWE